MLILGWRWLDHAKREMHVLKNDMQKMSNSLEMIQQILQAMTTPHPSPAPSSSTSEHPPISQFALWN
ncbi:hypothetical protein COCNU_scaffold012629G000030 [Cocos nucifera]|nr:hypothetical protein [Cocos nucifera]